MGTDKHPVSDRVKPSFVISTSGHSTLALRAERKNARMSIAVPIWQQCMGFKGLMSGKQFVVRVGTRHRVRHSGRVLQFMLDFTLSTNNSNSSSSLDNLTC